MVNKSIIGAVCTCLAVVSVPANGHLFVANGSLSTPGGIDGLGSWGAGPTTLSWDVNHPEGCCESYYTYTFEHPETNTFEVIIEVHPNMVTNPSGVEIYNVSSTLPI